MTVESGTKQDFLQRVCAVVVDFNLESVAPKVRGLPKIIARGNIDDFRRMILDLDEKLAPARRAQEFFATLPPSLRMLGVKMPPEDYILQALGLSRVKPDSQPIEATARREDLSPNRGTRQENKRLNDLAKVEIRHVYPALAIDRGKGGWVYVTRRSCIEAIRAEELGSLSGEALQAGVIRAEASFSTAIRGVIMKIQAAQSAPQDKVPPELQKLFVYLQDEPEYNGQPPDVLEKAMKRKITFGQLKALQHEQLFTTPAGSLSEGRHPAVVVGRVPAVTSPSGGQNGSRGEVQDYTHLELLTVVSPFESILHLIASSIDWIELDDETLNEHNLHLPFGQKLKVQVLAEKLRPFAREVPTEAEGKREIQARISELLAKASNGNSMLDLTEDGIFLLGLLGRIPERRRWNLLGLNFDS